MKSHLIAFIFLALLLSSCTNDSDTNYKKNVLVQQLDSLLSYCYENGMFNGTILLTKNDSLIYSSSYGFKNEESKEKIDTESIFYIASVSKQFTAMGILRLSEKQLLSIDDKLNKFLPDLILNEAITIRQLLNHTSGITDAKYYQIEKPSNQNVIEALKNQEASEFGVPGDAFRYSNSGYVLLAAVIEKITGNTIEYFFEQEFFIPLNMNRTTVSKSKLATMSNKTNGYNVIGNKSDNQSEVIGPGGIYSTVNDLQKWNKAINQHLIVTERNLKEAFTNGKVNELPISIKVLDQDFGYGFGWFQFTRAQYSFVQHDGLTDGYRSLIKKNLTTGYDYILLTNHGSSLAMNEINQALDAIIEKREYSFPNIPITTLIINELKTNNIDVVIEKIKNRINNDSEKPKPDERILGGLGFTFLKEKMIREAIGLFQLNAELYPNSPSIYYSLGEGYVADEQYEKAKQSYLKYLEFNPSSKHVKQKLQVVEEKMQTTN